MSMAAVRPYFRARANQLKWKEWREDFTLPDIPDSIIDGNYHIELDAAAGRGMGNMDLECSMPVTVTYFKKGYAENADAVDAVIAVTERFIKECLRASNRATGNGAANAEGIKNVQFQSCRWEAFSPLNNKLIKVTMDFSVTVIVDLES